MLWPRQQRHCNWVDGRGRSFISSPKHMRPWGSSSLPFSGYQRLFPRGWSNWGMKLTAHHHLELKLRMYGVLPPLPHGCIRFDASISTESTQTLTLYTHIKYNPKWTNKPHPWPQTSMYYSQKAVNTSLPFVPASWNLKLQVLWFSSEMKQKKYIHIYIWH